MRRIAQAGWWALSIGLFVAIWELAWAVGWADPKVLPPPHLFLGDFHNQAQYFDTSQVIAGEEASAAWGVAHSVSATILRVLVGLALGFALAVLVGIGTRYFRLFGKLVLPSVTLLAPVSPLAWLPVAIYTSAPATGRRSSWCSSPCSSLSSRDDQRDRQRRPDLPQRRADHGRER